jgi:DNA-binding MurR/RpiR family transcriptional regulator
VVRGVVTEAQRAISDTGELIDEDDIETAARRLLGAQRIAIFGVGASGIIAEYFLYKLIRLGLSASAHRDPHLASMSTALLGKSDVAIGISSSGSIRDTVEALRLGREAGAFTIAITNRPRSPLTAHAELVLLAANPESPLTGGAVLSKVSQLLLLEALFNVMLRLEPDRYQIVQLTAEAVVEKSF